MGSRWTILDRYRRLSLWNQLYVLAAIASILGLVVGLYTCRGRPQTHVPSGPRANSVDASPGATVLQSGRDIIITPPGIKSDSNLPDADQQMPAPAPRSGKKSAVSRTSPSSISVQSNNQQGGITAGIININPTPKPLLLSIDQQELVRASVAQFAGNSVEIVINRPTEDTAKFGKDLQAALARARIHSELVIVTGMYAPPPNCLDHPGVWFIVGANRMEEAKILAVALGKSGVVQGKVPGCSAGKADEFTVVISRP